MKTFLFYTADGSCFAPNGEQVATLQVLGFENGETADEALRALLEKNGWIEATGFSREEIWWKEIK